MSALVYLDDQHEKSICVTRLVNSAGLVLAFLFSPSLHGRGLSVAPPPRFNNPPSHSASDSKPQNHKEAVQPPPAVHNNSSESDGIGQVGVRVEVFQKREGGKGGGGRICWIYSRDALE